SSFHFMPDAPATEVAVKIVLFNAIWIPLHIVWLWAGIGLRRMSLSAKVSRAINVAMAIAMLAVVALAAFRG
ncbi:MAG: LysE family translocator, partial [Pseudomonadota bacterium]